MMATVKDFLTVHEGRSNYPEIPDSSNCEGFCGSDLGYDITAFDMAAGIKPTSILCLGKMWRKTFPAHERGERQLEALKAL